MIRKLIPVVLLAGLAACTTTGQRTSSSDVDSTTSSTPSSSAPSGAEGSGSYGGESTDSGGYGGGYSGGYGGGYGGGYSPSFTSDKSCDAAPVQNMIGTQLTTAVENQIRQASSSTKTRVLKPGEVMTMEYDPHRINLILDQQGALTALRCG